MHMNFSFECLQASACSRQERAAVVCLRSRASTEQELSEHLMALGSAVGLSIS